jgi:hypothetical protein
VGALRRIAALGFTVLLVPANGAAAAGPDAGIVARASLEPAHVQFGDPVTARVVVLVDRRVVRPDSVRVAADISPLTQLGPLRTTHERHGPLDVISITRTGSCMSTGCVSDTGQRTLALPVVRVDAASATGGGVHVRAPWPALDVRGRVTAAELGRNSPPFRADTTPPAPGYRVAPSALAAGLDVLATVLAVAGLALGTALAARAARQRQRRRESDRDELSRALRLAREAGARDPPDRRRALGLVARLLDARDRRLAGAARELAWSRPAPEPAPVAALLDEVEREVAG